MHDIILVDENDHQIGTCDKLEAHQHGYLHRAFSIFIFSHQDSVDKVLLQKRHGQKYHSAGLWSNTCCSHPRPGETVMAAANRRMKEEFGFTVPLTIVGSFVYKTRLNEGLIEHEYDYILVGRYQNELIHPNPDEITAFDWIAIPKLLDSLAKNPEYYTVWLREALMIALSQKLDHLG